MNGFDVRDPPKRGLLGRLFGLKAPEEAYTDLENLLAVAPIVKITPQEVSGILALQGLDVTTAHERLKKIYATVLTHFARDLELSEQEIADLRHLKFLFGLTDHDVEAVERAALDPHYESTLREMLKDRRLSDEEKQRLASIAQRLRLPQSISGKVYQANIQTLLQAAYGEATSDRRLSDTEEAELKAIAENVGVSLSMNEASQTSLEYFRLLWRLEQGDLPVVQVHLNLRRGELCHASIPATHLERRTVTKAIRYAGPSARIRIVKGLYYRAGQTNIERVTQELMHPLDTGTLYLTNKRLLFDGTKKSSTIALAKIIDFTIHVNGIMIEKETGKDQFFEIDDRRLELWGLMLRGALRKLHDG